MPRLVARCLLITFALSGAGISGQPWKESAQKVFDGDPVDLSTGLYVNTYTDFFLPGDPPIKLTRTYRTLDRASRAFGIGCNHSYDVFLTGDPKAFSFIDLILEDGGRIHFSRISPGRGYADAVLEHTSTPTKFYQSRIRWNGSAWDLTLKDKSKYVFPDSHDAVRPQQAAMVGYRDGEGHPLALTRDANANLVRIGNFQGSWVKLSYDTQNRIIQGEDSTGRVLTYEYDPLGRLTMVRYPDRAAVQYSYDALDRLRTLEDDTGFSFMNWYDSAGRVSLQVLPDGGLFRFNYTVNDAGQISATEIVHPDGSLRRLTFNPSGYTLTDTETSEATGERTQAFERDPRSNFVRTAIGPQGQRTKVKVRPPSSAKRVYLFPFGDFPPSALKELAAYCQKSLGLDASVLPSIALASGSADVDRRQFVAEALIAVMKRGSGKLAKDPEAILIGITSEDMYALEDPTGPFAVTCRQSQRFAVISSARLDPVNYGGPPNRALLRARLRKVLLRDVGLLYYDLPLSDDPRSVLFRHLDEATDLDDVGESF